MCAEEWRSTLQRVGIALGENGDRGVGFERAGRDPRSAPFTRAASAARASPGPMLSASWRAGGAGGDFALAAVGQGELDAVAHGRFLAPTAATAGSVDGAKQK